MVDITPEELEKIKQEEEYDGKLIQLEAELRYLFWKNGILVDEKMLEGFIEKILQNAKKVSDNLQKVC